MTTEELAFLKAIDADPDEDTNRLALADWYDERDAEPVGCPAGCLRDAVRQEYIVHVGGGRHGGWGTCDTCGGTGSVPGYPYRSFACGQRLAVLLRQIKVAPDDDAPRLKYAEVCERYGLAERAEFIRVQVELFRNFPTDTPKALGSEAAYERWRWLVARERELLTVGCALQWAGRPACLPHHNGIHPAFSPWQFRRGFLDSVTCTAEDWLEHADAIVAAHPITRVTLTTWPDYRTWHSVANRIYYFEVLGEGPAFTLCIHERDWINDPWGFTRERMTLAVLKARWPGIEFTLPPESELTIEVGPLSLTDVIIAVPGAARFIHPTS